MGAFDLQNRTIRDDTWAEGEEVVIRELNFGELTDLEALPFKSLTLGEASDKQKMKQIKLGKLDPNKMQIAKMKMCIVSWTFTEGNGKQSRPMPVNETTIRALSKSYGSFIKEQIEELNPTRDEEFQGDGRDGDEKQEREASTGTDSIAVDAKDGVHVAGN